MTNSVTERVADRVIERGWNNGDLDAIDEVVAEGYVRHLSDGRTLRSRAEFKQHMADIRAAMPDLHTEVHHSFSDGVNGAARFTMTGTPGGRALKFDGAVVVRLEHGMLVEEWEFFDTAAIAAAMA